MFCSHNIILVCYHGINWRGLHQLLHDFRIFLHWLKTLIISVELMDLHLIVVAQYFATKSFTACPPTIPVHFHHRAVHFVRRRSLELLLWFLLLRASDIELVPIPPLFLTAIVRITSISGTFRSKLSWSPVELQKQEEDYMYTIAYLFYFIKTNFFLQLKGATGTRKDIKPMTCCYSTTIDVSWIVELMLCVHLHSHSPSAASAIYRFFWMALG